MPLTVDHAETRRLLAEKASHYEGIAKDLMDGESVAASSFSPRSPIAKETFFTEESSVIPLPAPPPTSQLLYKLQTLASQANTKLSRALDLDEDETSQHSNKESTMQTYMEAAELYLEAIKQAQSTTSGSDDQRVREVATVLTRRLQQTLDRVEELKGNKTVVRNERVKLEQHTPEQKPEKAYKLTKEEIQILKRSSLIASGLFLPWSDEEAKQLSLDAAANSKTVSLFTDPSGFLPLNERQQKRFFKWARPQEVIQMQRKHRASNSSVQSSLHVVQTITPYSIQQQYVTDCSFIASLCICAAFERRFGKQLVSSLLYPQRIVANGVIVPFINPFGKYMVKFWLNGVARSVVIDDFLPVDKDGNLLCSISTAASGSSLSLELWVCLIEKAYMKLCGGYDFPGSNSGVDLFSLTGWIPERILFAEDPQNVRDFETAPERVWDRIFGASSFGDCLITVSSERGVDTREEVVETGLVTGHAYAVLNVVQTKSGLRLLLLRNPWGRQEWKGRYSSQDLTNWTPELCAEVGYNSSLDRNRDNGVFWICWDDILKYFQNFHLSWNPQLFRNRMVQHGFWAQGVAPEDDSFNVGENPQYIVMFSAAAVKQKATMWILVSRHVNKQEQEGCVVNDYLTVHVHRNNEKKGRIWYPGKAGDCILTGVYTNNPHVLIRYDIQGPSDRFLSLVLSQYKKSNDLGYTISCYCTEAFTFTQPSLGLPCCIKLASQWTEAKSGGPLGSSGSRNNPQFAVTVPVGGATIQISVVTVRTAAVCVILVPVASFGHDIAKAKGKPIIDTGKYRHGFAVSDQHLVPHGSYTLLVSNYDAGKLASFEVNILSSVKLKAREIE